MSAEAEALAFWRGVCAARAWHADHGAACARTDERIHMDLPMTADGYRLDAERYEARAAWLREKAGES